MNNFRTSFLTTFAALSQKGNYSTSFFNEMAPPAVNQFHCPKTMLPFCSPIGAPPRCSNFTDEPNFFFIVSSYGKWCFAHGVDYRLVRSNSPNLICAPQFRRATASSIEQHHRFQNLFRRIILCALLLVQVSATYIKEFLGRLHK